MPDLFVAQGLDYNPVQGELVLIEYLPSGRPILVVELLNSHRVRAILSNDDIHSDSLPTIGTHVECVQNQGIWSYVRTIDVLQGRAVVNVQGAGIVATADSAHLYSTPNHFLGMSHDEVLLNGTDSQVRMTEHYMELSGPTSGIRLGSTLVDGQIPGLLPGVSFTGGRTNTPSGRHIPSRRGTAWDISHRRATPCGKVQH